MKEIKEISSEELFDLFHLMGNCIELEWHSIENGELNTCKYARNVRHKMNKYLLGKELGEPQMLCQLKHTLSMRTQAMELMEKWHKAGKKEMVKLSQEMIDKLGQELVYLIDKIRKKKLDIKT